MFDVEGSVEQATIENEAMEIYSDILKVNQYQRLPELIKYFEKYKLKEIIKPTKPALLLMKYEGKDCGIFFYINESLIIDISDSFWASISNSINYKYYGGAYRFIYSIYKNPAFYDGLENIVKMWTLRKDDRVITALLKLITTKHTLDEITSDQIQTELNKIWRI